MVDNKIFIVFIFIFLNVNLALSQNLPNDSTKVKNQPKDTTMLTFNKNQYGKMISKGDVYFSQKEYLKSKKMYERATRFQPNWNNLYPNNRIDEIEMILEKHAQSIEVYVKEYDEIFHQGITEERTDLKFNIYNEPIAYEIRRIVVIGKSYSIYKKYVVRSIITYTKNGVGVTKQVWSESNNVLLKWN